MATVDSQIYDEVLAEITRYQKPVAFKIQCIIDIDGFLLSPYKVVNEDGLRDFHNKFSDEIVLEVAISEGDFNRYVYPSAQKLQIQLITTAIGELEDIELKDRQPVIRRYRAILQNNANMDLQGLPSTSGDNTFISVSFQLIEMAADLLRLQTVGGTFYKTTTIDVIRTILGNHSKSLKLPDEVAVKGVHHFSPNNDTVRENVVIPHGTELLDLAGYVQKYCGGVYNQGIGLYLHKNIWFVYPLMDKSRYETERLALDVFLIPQNRMPQSERTYQIKDQRVQILITGDVKQSSNDISYMRFGNGTIFGNATKLFNDFAKVEGNVATADVTENTSRFIIERKDTDLKFTPFSSNRITDNAAYEISKIVSRSGQMTSVVWENARPDLIYPGMPVKFFYGTESGSSILYGQVVAVQYHTTLNQPGMTGERCKTNCVLSFFLDTRE